MKDNIPTLIGFYVKYGSSDVIQSMCVWCPYCCKWHFHLLKDNSKKAKCKEDSNSPFIQTGYHIMISKIGEIVIRYESIKDEFDDYGKHCTDSFDMYGKRMV